LLVEEGTPPPKGGGATKIRVEGKRELYRDNVLRRKDRGKGVNKTPRKKGENYEGGGGRHFY